MSDLSVPSVPLHVDDILQYLSEVGQREWERAFLLASNAALAAQIGELTEELTKLREDAEVPQERVVE